MFYSEKDDREKRLRFSIRKVSFGAASVAVAALYLFMGSGAVSAEEAQAVQSNEEVAADKDSETEKNQRNSSQPTLLLLQKNKDLQPILKQGMKASKRVIQGPKRKKQATSQKYVKDVMHLPQQRLQPMTTQMQIKCIQLQEMMQV
ncbi:hypothetical protein U750_07625 [Streptococcus pseudopneumoniae G42]|nr:hypothetical protein U750_07625 [Streptococcus pseudopneumoniae G42]